MDIVPQAEDDVSALEKCATAFSSVQVDVFAPRGYNQCECDWIAIRVMRLRLLYEASQISESGYMVWHVIAVGLHNARDDRTEHFECSWPVLNTLRAPYQ